MPMFPITPHCDHLHLFWNFSMTPHTTSPSSTSWHMGHASQQVRCLGCIHAYTLEFVSLYQQVNIWVGKTYFRKDTHQDELLEGVHFVHFVNEFLCFQWLSHMPQASTESRSDHLGSHMSLEVKAHVFPLSQDWRCTFINRCPYTHMMFGLQDPSLELQVTSPSTSWCNLCRNCHSTGMTISWHPGIVWYPSMSWMDSWKIMVLWPRCTLQGPAYSRNTCVRMLGTSDLQIMSHVLHVGPEKGC